MAEASVVLEALADAGVLETLTPKQVAVMAMVFDDGARAAMRSGESGWSTLSDSSRSAYKFDQLSTAELSALATFPEDKLDTLRIQFDSAFSAGIAAKDMGQVAVMPAFVAGMAVGYAAYAYAHHYPY